MYDKYDQSLVTKIPRPILMAIKFDRFPDMMPPGVPDDETEYPPVLVFWLDERLAKYRRKFMHGLVNEYRKGGKQSHWIWWVYPNIEKHTPGGKHIELLSEKQYELLKTSKDYQKTRMFIDKIVEVKGLTWFNFLDRGRIKAFVKLHDDEYDYEFTS